MRRYLILVTALLAVTALSGCSDDPNPVIPDNSTTSLNAAARAVPAHAVIDSAYFHLHVSASDTQSVLVHRVTQDWDEGDVTFNSFAAGFESTPLATVPIEVAGWYSVNVSTQAQGWLDSTLDNFGFFVQPIDADTGFSIIDSREAAANQPYLEVFYTTSKGEFVEMLDAAADAHIYSADPDMNYGTETSLMVQRQTGADSTYQSLIRFEFPVEVFYSSVGDMVWMDDNADGIQDEGEAGIGDIEIHLYTCEGTWLASTMTDESGMYLFDGLEAGEYYLTFVNPLGHIFTYQDMGDDDALDSDVDRYQKRTACFTLEPGDEITDWDAGLFAFDGCTYGKGYWKNHAGFGPQADQLSDLLPIWLGDDDGDKSLAVDNAEMAVALLQQHEYGHPKNGITKLYAHLLTTKLNIVNFANPEDIHEAVNDADSFLADHDWMDWETLDKEDQKMVLEWKDMFEQYNEGDIGPGHCDEDDSDHMDNMF